MTKKKPQPRSGAAAAPQVKTEEILPSGGLAIPKEIKQEPASASTTSAGAVTPGSSPSDKGGYFGQFKDFTPQVDAGFLSQFNQLAIHENWSNREKARRRNEAVEFELAHYFGTDTKDVAKWQELCGVVGIETEGLTSITKCKKALGARKVMVNLVNLVDHLKYGTPLLKFKNYHAFQRYTMKKGQRMSRKLAKKDGFLKVFLRHVF